MKTDGVIYQFNKDAFLGKYKNYTFDTITMFNFHEPFDPTETILYQSIFQKGIEADRQQIAKNMLTEGFDLALIQRLTNLSLEQIQKLKND